MGMDNRFLEFIMRCREFAVKKKTIPYSAVRIGGLLILFMLPVLAVWLVNAARIDPAAFDLPDDCRFFDRHGRLLRHLPDEKGERHIRVALTQIPLTVQHAFIAAEDERFFRHGGYDSKAIVRAALANVRAGRIVSGASTITQQLCRLVYPRPRTYTAKLIEVVRSIRAERAFNKEQILEKYLNRVPMGHAIVGVALAARQYFGKACADLSVGEAALLAALPKAPGRLSPFGRHRRRLLARQKWVLGRMHRLGFIDAAAYQQALAEPLVFQRPAYPLDAPHVIDLLRARLPAGMPGGDHYTTIDTVIQRKLQHTVRSHADRLAYRGARQAAAMIVSNATGDVLASVGSLAYGAAGLGFNNGTTALRSAGSTLKPFAYALALEDGDTGATLVADTLQKYRSPQGDYTPANYDRHQYGPVTLRLALGNSLNITAIKVLERVGLERFYTVLKGLDLINSPGNGPDHYGLGLVLGNPEVSLEQLAAAYAGLANGGRFRPLRYRLRADRPAAAQAVFSAPATYIISDILADPTARVLTFGSTGVLQFPFKVAFKTGTSTHFRDGWIVGYTPDYTVGVWVGNFDGAPTYRLSGAAGAGPIFKEILTWLYARSTPQWPEPPPQVVRAPVCGISGMAPGPHCAYVSQELFVRGTQHRTRCRLHPATPQLHRLPAEYALWLHERSQQGLAGNYRLNKKVLRKTRQEVAVQDDLALPESSRPGIRIKGVAASAPQKTIKVYQQGRLTIGAGHVHGTTGAGRVRIVYPLAADRFVVADGRNRIMLRATCDQTLAYVDWFIDNEHYARVGPPYQVGWFPQKGRHVIMVAGPRRNGDAVEILVE